MSIKTLIKAPLIIEDNDIFYQYLKDKINKEIDSHESKPFSFYANNKIHIEEYRSIYDNDIIRYDESIKKDLNYFAKEKVPQFLEILKKEFNDEDYIFKGIEKIKYVLRVRIIEDKEKYNLAPHRDSQDTIFSFIMHLNNKNSQTCLYKMKNPFSFKIKNLDEYQNEIQNYLINERKNIDNLFWGDNQFGGVPFLWVDKICYQFNIKNNIVHAVEYHEIMEKISSNTIYAIHNVKNSPLTSTEYNKRNSIYYHGVKPIQEKRRKILIMDLLAQETDEEFLNLKGIGESKDTFYIVYKLETSKKLSEILK